MTTFVPRPTFGDKGFVAPAETEIRDGRFADINAAFGGNLDPDPASPQGQLATSEAAIIGDCNNLFLLFANLVDPARSSGKMQDGIGRIYFIERIPASATVATCVCVGKVGVVIPAGSRVQDDEGNTYVSLHAATIGAAGQVDVSFANQVSGPIACPAGAITTIVDGVSGWDTVANTFDGVIGRDVESPADFEYRRALSVAKNSLGSLPSLRGTVWSVPDVVDVYVAENTARVATSVKGVLLNPNSLYVAVKGGANDAVAKAIWSKKSPGCGYTGNTSVVVSDDVSYEPPYPTYNVLFQRPTDLPIYVDVLIEGGALVPANADSTIKTAVTNAFSGTEGADRNRIGVDYLASRLYAPVIASGSWVKVRSILLASPNVPDGVGIATIAGTTLSVSTVMAGVFGAGQVVFCEADGFVAGTRIIDQISGTPGGVGAYTVSAAQTVSPTNFKSAAPTRFEIPVNIDQWPVTSAALVSVRTS